MTNEFVGWWRRRYGDTAPLGYRLRAAEKDRWLRLHSLPESKRYAETDSEWAELLHRSNQAATELLAEGGEVWLLVARYLFASESGRDSLELDCLAEPLPSLARFRLDESEDAEAVQVFGSRLTWRPGQYDELLSTVADDQERATLVSSATGEVVAPYAGGVDLILADSVRRDALRVRFSDWLSRHPQGL